jgi:hypothetical protein
LLHVAGKKVICPRTKSNVKLNKAGYLHKVHDNGLLNKSIKPNKHKSNRAINWTRINRQYKKKIHPCDKIRLDHEIGLQNDSTLWNFGIGWDGEAYTFPAYDGSKRMIGIQRRFPDGGKVWVPRSRNGLFIPLMKSFEGNVFVTEGLTDAAALVDMGFRAIARSNCQTGLDYIKQLLRTHKGVLQVVVVADNDPVGQKGAASLARGLYGLVENVAVLEPPSEYKDVRAWYKDGGGRSRITKADIIYRIRKL